MNNSNNIIFDVLIEIPKGSRNKYEFDQKTGLIRLDRVLHSTMNYPTDYGYIPNTLALDGDPLDVLVSVTEATIPGCMIKVKPIAVLYMSDDKGQDEKILCVPLYDPNYNMWNNIDEVPSHTLKEIEHFFKVYKNLENKVVNINGWGNVDEAINVYKECIKRYNK